LQDANTNNLSWFLKNIHIYIKTNQRKSPRKKNNIGQKKFWLPSTIAAFFCIY
jgi:hypothetical protein